jgi:hypothetical protein
VLTAFAVLLNPGRPLAAWSMWGAFSTSAFPITMLIVGWSIGHTFLRVRAAVARAQIRWVLWGILFTSGGAFVGFSLGLMGLLGRFPVLEFFAHRLPMLAFPLSLAIAILRYRLWDIDVFTNRAMVYGLLTVCLGAVFVGTLLSVEQLILRLTDGRSDGAELAVVAATVMLVTLFRPLRSNVQTYVDRHFYRRKYDAGRVLAAFGAAMRDEVDLSRVTAQLLAVVHETVQPAHVSLWLRPVGRRGGDVREASGSLAAPVKDTVST